MYSPAISPAPSRFSNARLMFVSSDLGGLYRSTDGGSRWRMVDERQMLSNVQDRDFGGYTVQVGYPVAFHPTMVVAYGLNRGLRVSPDGGVTWKTFPFPLSDSSGAFKLVTAIAFDGNNRLFVGTTDTAHYSDFNVTTGTWSSWNLCKVPGAVNDSPGTVISFVFAPAQAVYFLATTTRIYRSFDQGATWQPVPGAFPNPAPSVVIRSFAGGSDARQVVLYVTLPSAVTPNGTFQGGVYISTDKGDMWSQINSGLLLTQGADSTHPCYVPQYEHLGVDVKNPSIAYVTVCAVPSKASDNNRLYKSTDAGMSWMPILNVDADFPYPPKTNIGGWVEYEPADVGKGFGGRGLGFTVCQSSFYHSTDVFTNLGGPYIANKPRSFIELIITDLNRMICLFIKFIIQLLGYDASNIVCPFIPFWEQEYTNQNSMVATQPPKWNWSSRGLEVTTTWQYYIDPHDVQKPLGQQHHYICYTDIGFASSRDGGQTWQSTAPFNTQTGRGWDTVYELAFDPDVPGRIWAAVAELHDIPSYQYLQDPHSLGGGGVMMSTDFGQSWMPQTGPFATPPDPTVPDAPAVSITLDRNLQMGGRRLWVSIWGDGVYRSDDGGRTWQRKSTGLGNPQPNPTNKHIYRLHHHPDNTLNGKLFCSIAGNRQSDLFLEAGGLWQSVDGGNTWTGITQAPFTSSAPSDFGQAMYSVVDYVVHPTNPNIIYLCSAPQLAIGSQPFTDGSLFQTLDGGKTWSELTSFRAAVTAISPRYYPDYVYTFAPFLDPTNPNIIYVTTTKSGTWRSPDGGLTWAEYPTTLSDLPCLSTHRITFAGDGATYFTTFGGGVWKVTPTPNPLLSWLQGVFCWWRQRPPVLVLTIAALGGVGLLVARWRRRRAAWRTHR
jgi:hypothetical protein